MAEQRLQADLGGPVQKSLEHAQKHRDEAEHEGILAEHFENKTWATAVIPSSPFFARAKFACSLRYGTGGMSSRGVSRP
jgi:hypothetical protein